MATKTAVQSGSGKAYTAAPKDNTLPSHLHEAFRLLEIRFANYDHDGAETLMFKELERELSLVGFSDPKLEATFKRFDFDGGHVPQKTSSFSLLGDGSHRPPFH